ncbi:hypothetical protein BGZ83_008866 [Gryganskiella cystojenkinii]|nr:hypothetical protein BGZ83_008866 [Gryganskiella cystojenkinii]
MERSALETVLRIIRTTLGKRINQTAQISLANDILCVAVGLRSASLVDQLYLNENDIERIQSMFHHSSKFSQLDLLSIGEDHVFIIHRTLLLQDIQDYLTNSSKGLHRVFVNVDYRLSQPELIPENRCRPLENYIQKRLLPEILDRIQSWDQAERCYEPLPIPPRRLLSLVTLTGWLLSYPINYVLSSPSPSPQQSQKSQKLEEKHHHVVGEYESHWSDYGAPQDSDEEATGDMDEKEYDHDANNGRNCLANQALVVTRVQLEPSNTVDGLRDHCLLSFSYPAELAERYMDCSQPLPPSPLSPSTPGSPTMAPTTSLHEDKGYRQDSDDDGDNDDEFVDALSSEGEDEDESETNRDENNDNDESGRKSTKIPIRSRSSASSSTKLSKEKSTPSFIALEGQSASTLIAGPSPWSSREFGSLQHQDLNERHAGDKPDLTPAAVQNNSNNNNNHKHNYKGSHSMTNNDENMDVFFSNPDICAAGRSFLHQLHNRFQKQTIWKTWQVGQQTVTLPVVAM